MRSVSVLLFAFVLITPLAMTQQIAFVGSTTADAPYQINNPDKIQLFYGSLDGAPAFFRMTSDKPFALHVQALAPYANGYDPGAHPLTIIVLTENRREIGTVLENSYIWSTKQIDGISYFAAPAVNQDVPAGSYTVRLQNTGNSAKYVLEVGTQEEGPGLDTLLLPIVRQSTGFNVAAGFTYFLGIIVIAASAAVLLSAGMISKKNKETNRLIIDFFRRAGISMWAGFVLAFIGWYLSGSFDSMSRLRVFLLTAMLAHWMIFFVTNSAKIRKIRTRAIFAEKFQNRFIRGMLIELLLVVLLVFYSV